MSRQAPGVAPGLFVLSACFVVYGVFSLVFAWSERSISTFAPAPSPLLLQAAIGVGAVAAGAAMLWRARLVRPLSGRAHGGLLTLVGAPLVILAACWPLAFALEPQSLTAPALTLGAGVEALGAALLWRARR